MRKAASAFFAIIALLVAVSAGNFFYGWTAAGPLTADKTVQIPSGVTMTAAVKQLEEEGVIRSAEAFLNRAKIFGSNDPIKAGEFLFPKGVSNSGVLKIMQGGVAQQRMITIPEGMPAILVHERIMAEPLLTGTIAVPAEGSVLPESYSFERGESRQAVLDRMQKAMNDTLAELWPKRSANAVVQTPQEAVTLAAIVEKETALDSERRTVAAVYSNRIRKGMMLQADPTTIYPITKGKPLGRRIRRSELNEVNDYNTYAKVGLPIGPIANPGRKSIEAVLNPNDSPALYFVADGKGGHIFANSLEEHNANVEKWYAIRRARGEM